MLIPFLMKRSKLWLTGLFCAFFGLKMFHFCFMKTDEYFKLCWERYKMELNNKAHIDVHSYHPSGIITATFAGLFYLVKDYSYSKGCAFELGVFMIFAFLSLGFGVACGYYIFKAYIPPVYQVINSPEAYHPIFQECKSEYENSPDCFEDKMIEKLNQATTLCILNNRERMKYIYKAKRTSIGAIGSLFLATIPYLYTHVKL